MILSYVTYALLAITASALLLVFCLALLVIQEGLRIAHQTWLRMIDRRESGELSGAFRRI